MQAVQPCMRKASVRECETDWVCLFATHSCLRRSSLLLLLLPSSWHQCEYPADDVTTSPRGQTTHKVKLGFHTNHLNIKTICCPTGLVCETGCLRAHGTQCHSDLVDLNLCDPNFQLSIRFTWLLSWVCSCWHLIAQTSVDLNVASWIRTRCSLCRRRFTHLYAIYSCVLSLWWENTTLSFTLPLYWSTCSIVILRNSSRNNITECGFHLLLLKNIRL